MSELFNPHCPTLGVGHNQSRTLCFGTVRFFYTLSGSVASQHGFITAGQGLEPQYSPPEGDVLPLDEPATLYQYLLKY